MKRMVKDGLMMAIQVACIVFVTKSFAFATNYIPSESMVPSLEVGDRILVSKWPWGYSRASLLVDPGIDLPGKDGRLFGAVPERGDIAVFTHPQTGETMVKRVIGLPGDRIALSAGRLYINGQLVERRAVASYAYRDPSGSVTDVVRYDEVLPGGRVHPIIERGDDGLADTMPEVTIPDGHLFMMGDNRDNSGDSRFWRMGFVPLAKLQGRVDLVAWSIYDCPLETGLACAERRFLADPDQPSIPSNKADDR